MIWLNDEKQILTKNDIRHFENDSKSIYMSDYLMRKNNEYSDPITFAEKVPLNDITVLGLDAVSLKTSQKMMTDSYRKSVTKQIISEATGSYRGDVINLARMFAPGKFSDELDEIAFLAVSPYFDDLVWKVFTDYYNFFQVFPYLNFQERASFDLPRLHMIKDLEEREKIFGSPTVKLLEHEEEAQINSEILRRTRKIYSARLNFLKKDK